MISTHKTIPINDPFPPLKSGSVEIVRDLTSHLDRTPGKLWFVGIFVSILFLSAGAWGVYQTVYYGIGVWGINRTVGWGMGITNFVWWIGIGHAGTFISAILMILGQGWRTSINRAAEAMTIFSVLCAAFYPIIHLGRQAFFFFTIPYPNTRNLWVNFNSPLTWDVFAIITYFILSLIFWYVGMIPDLALVRDRQIKRFHKWVYKTLSLGWQGSVREWKSYESFNYFAACLATPLVVSVHSVVSMDFATSLVPGWHSTIFPLYFVAGAILSGFSFVNILLLITRQTMNLENYITRKHFNMTNKIILITGSILASAYAIELYFFLGGDNLYEKFIAMNRFTGAYRYAFFGMLLFNVIIPQLFWIKKLRENLSLTMIFSIFILFGMWLERFVIVVGSLHRDYLPSVWIHYFPTLTELTLFIGTLGFFILGYLLFVRYLPFIPVSEHLAIIQEEHEKN